MKPLPSDTELERVVLGYMLVYGKEAEDIMVDLEIEYFYDAINRKIARTIYEMAIFGEEIDITTVNSKLKDQNWYKDNGGTILLVDLTSKAVVIETIQTMVERLKLLYQKREIIKEGVKIQEIGYNSDLIEKEISESFNTLDSILNKSKSNIVSLEDSVANLKKTIEENKRKELIGLSWGENFKWLDKFTGGIRKGKTYRIAGTSGAGKTSVMYQVIHNIIQQKEKVLFLSLENSIETTLINFLSTVQGVNPQLLEKGFKPLESDYIIKNKEYFELTDQLFDLNDLKRQIIKSRPRVVVLDYIGLVQIQGFNEKDKYDKYADEIKVFMQKHQDITFIDLSNLTKSDNEETIRKGSGYNGSAKLKNNCDFGLHIFPYKPFMDYKKTVMQSATKEVQDKFLGKRALTFLITKNRLGDNNVEQNYIINYNRGIRFSETTEEMESKWNVL